MMLSCSHSGTSMDSWEICLYRAAMSAAERSRVENNMYRKSNSIVVFRTDILYTHLCLLSKCAKLSSIYASDCASWFTHDLKQHVGLTWNSCRLHQTTHSTVFYLECGFLGISNRGSGVFDIVFLNLTSPPPRPPQTHRRTHSHTRLCVTHTQTNKETHNYNHVESQLKHVLLLSRAWEQGLRQAHLRWCDTPLLEIRQGGGTI